MWLRVAAIVLVVFLAACATDAGNSRASGRLSFPSAAGGECSAGTRRIDVSGALLHVPPSRTFPAPLMLVFHGAFGNAASVIAQFAPLADRGGVILVAPQAADVTWDYTERRFEDDFRALDRALGRVHRQCRIDPSHTAVAGFSDGASYALSLGLINGDRFSHVLAFSPGFAAARGWTGHPRVFISHAPGDPVLPFATTSRIVDALREHGYAVDFVTFEGGHELPEAVLRQAFSWFLPGAAGRWP